MTTKVVIVQPYVPAYRLAFFESLRSKLIHNGINCTVAAGVPQGKQAKRADAATAEWLQQISYANVLIKGKRIDLAARPRPWQDADAVIMGLEGTSIPAYQALIHRARKQDQRVGLWGHVRPYVTAGQPIDLWLERRQMEWADHVFAYTPGGKSYAIEKGVPSKKITTVMNTVDTDSLRTQLERVSHETVQTFAKIHNFDPHRLLCYIGGMDESKNLELLVDALEFLWNTDRSVKILIGGKGEQEGLLEKAYQRHQAIPLGYLDVQAKALALRSSRAICMPGRIGLVAVDALVAHTPIITTDWPFHAPEAEYLHEGVSRITAPSSAQGFAEKILEFLNSGSDDQKVTDTRSTAWAYPTMQEMVGNYARGIQNMLQ